MESNTARIRKRLSFKWGKIGKTETRSFESLNRIHNVEVIFGFEQYIPLKDEEICFKQIGMEEGKWNTACVMYNQV